MDDRAVAAVSGLDLDLAVAAVSVVSGLDWDLAIDAASGLDDRAVSGLNAGDGPDDGPAAVFTVTAVSDSDAISAVLQLFSIFI